VGDPEVLGEYVRTALRRQICNALLKESQERGIAVLTLDGEAEELIREAVQTTPGGITVALAPDLAGDLFRRLTALVDRMIGSGQQPVVLTAPHVRLAFRKLTAANFPSLYVLSYNEIAPDVEVSSVGSLTLSHEDQEVRSPEYAGSPATGS
jgi:flagellar biosynthesis protein FlhA